MAKVMESKVHSSSMGMGMMDKSMDKKMNKMAKQQMGKKNSMEKGRKEMNKMEKY